VNQICKLSRSKIKSIGVNFGPQTPTKKHKHHQAQSSHTSGLESANFLNEVNRQFGVPWPSLKGVHMPAYDFAIPSVLISLQECLFLKQGHLQRGIFQTNADVRHVKRLKVNSHKQHKL
jgi:hypothetical protein